MKNFKYLGVSLSKDGSSMTDIVCNSTIRLYSSLMFTSIMLNEWTLLAGMKRKIWYLRTTASGGCDGQSKKWFAPPFFYLCFFFLR